MLQLTDIIGHTAPLKVLKSAINSGEIAHAYLFTGQEGVGKRSAALAWASILLCGKGGDIACGKCGNCIKMAKEVHPDLILASPVAREKKVKEELDITHIRELTKALSYRPYEAKIKVAIVDRADMMNTPAGNAFLKTLEEPPPDTVIILVTSNIRSLLPTIVSRCQVIRFGPVDHESVKTFLMDMKGMGENEAEAVAALAKGSPGTALNNEELESRKEVRSMAWRFLCGILDGDTSEVFKLAQAIDRSKERALVDSVLASIRLLLRDLAVLKTCGKYDNLINMDLGGELLPRSRECSLRSILRAHKIAVDISSGRLWNINPLLSMSLMALEMRK